MTIQYNQMQNERKDKSVSILILCLEKQMTVNQEWFVGLSNVTWLFNEDIMDSFRNISLRLDSNVYFLNTDELTLSEMYQVNNKIMQHKIGTFNSSYGKHMLG